MPRVPALFPDFRLNFCEKTDYAARKAVIGRSARTSRAGHASAILRSVAVTRRFVQATETPLQTWTRLLFGGPIGEVSHGHAISLSRQRTSKPWARDRANAHEPAVGSYGHLRGIPVSKPVVAVAALPSSRWPPARSAWCPTREPRPTAARNSRRRSRRTRRAAIVAATALATAVKTQKAHDTRVLKRVSRSACCSPRGSKGVLRKGSEQRLHVRQRSGYSSGNAAGHATRKEEGLEEGYQDGPSMAIWTATPTA